MDVFEKGGFDVMIGNPPYIQLQKMGMETDILQEAGFETFARTGDIYCLFYEKGFELLKNGGTLSYITSNSWMKTKYGKGLRIFFSKKSNPIKLLNFDDTQIFPSATVEVNIFIGKNEKRNQSLKTVSIGPDFHKGNSFEKYFDSKHFEITELDENGWVISTEVDMLVKLSMEQTGRPIKEWDLNIYIGILNGYNDAFLINSELKNKIIRKNPSSESIIHPILRGRDLKKYSYKWDDLWLINTHNGIQKQGIERINVEKDFPAIYEHLLPYEELLEIRQNKGDHWTNLRNCAYFLEFAKPKIIWGELSDIPKFAYDDSGMYAEATLFAMTGEKLKYLLTVLNSKIALWYFNQITTTSGMGTSRWKKYKIEQLPIPYLDINREKPFELIAEYLIYLNDPKQESVLEKVSNEAVIQVFEDLVNMMVYELYFEEEMKAKEIEVLQFVTEKTFPDITKSEAPKATIQKVYYELQQKDNPIRNRILVASSRSETIARINAATS
jgi:hypothetical protein